MGIGSARGEDRARQAAKRAVSSPLLESSIDGARGILLSIAGGSDLVCSRSARRQLIESSAHEEANIIFVTIIDDSLGDEVRFTVIASGYDTLPSTPRRPRQAEKPVERPAPQPQPEPVRPPVVDQRRFTPNRPVETDAGEPTRMTHRPVVPAPLAAEDDDLDA